MAIVMQQAFDLEASIERAGDHSFWQELVQTYLVETRRALYSLRIALGSRDMATLEREAHTIKGGSAELLMESMCELASEMERTARRGDVYHASGMLDLLEEEFALVENTVHEYVDGLPV